MMWLILLLYSPVRGVCESVAQDKALPKMSGSYATVAFFPHGG